MTTLPVRLPGRRHRPVNQADDLYALAFALGLNDHRGDSVSPVSEEWRFL